MTRQKSIIETERAYNTMPGKRRQSSAQPSTNKPDVRNKYSLDYLAGMFKTVSRMTLLLMIRRAILEWKRQRKIPSRERLFQIIIGISESVSSNRTWLQCLETPVSRPKGHLASEVIGSIAPTLKLTIGIGDIIFPELEKSPKKSAYL